MLHGGTTMMLALLQTPAIDGGDTSTAEAIQDALGVSYWVSAWHDVLSWFQLHGANIILILLLAWLLSYFARMIIGRVTAVIADSHRGDDLAAVEQEKRTKTVWSLFATAVRAVIYTVAALMILAEVGINITALLAGAGIAGIALGFGAQSVVKDMLAGLFMLIEDQYRVGDIIQVNGGEYGGAVEKMTLRTTWLRSLDGNVHIIPNGSINAISNFTHTWSRTELEFGISYGDDVDTAIRVIQETADALAQEEPWSAMILEPPEMLGVDELGDSAVTIKMLIKTVPIEQWRIGREMRRRVKYALEAAGMTIPFPQVTVSHLDGKPKDAPAAKASPEARPVDVDSSPHPDA